MKSITIKYSELVLLGLAQFALGVFITLLVL